MPTAAFLSPSVAPLPPPALDDEAALPPPPGRLNRDEAHQGLTEIVGATYGLIFMHSFFSSPPFSRTIFTHLSFCLVAWKMVWSLYRAKT